MKPKQKYALNKIIASTVSVINVTTHTHLPFSSCIVDVLWSMSFAGYGPIKQRLSYFLLLRLKIIIPIKFCKHLVLVLESHFFFNSR